MLPALAGTALILLAWTCLRAVLGTGVKFDDAFIANVAKNVAAGNGYSSSFYIIRPFDVEITTGPILVLPAAALIRLFGNRYWVPNLAYALVVWTLLAALLFLAQRRMKGEELWACACLIGLGLLTFMTREFGLLGEVPAALLVALAALQLTHVNSSRVPGIVFAGLAVGCAVITKTVAALAVPAFVAWLLWGRHGLGRRSLVWFAAGLVLPLCVLEAWKLATLPGGIAAWIRLTQVEIQDVFGAAATLSGASTLRMAVERPGLLAELTAQNATILAAWWSGWLPLGAAASATVVLAWTAWRAREDARSCSLTWAFCLLLGAALTHLAWWLVLTRVGWERHVLPGILYWLIAVALLLGLAVGRTPKMAAAAAGLLFVALTPSLIDLDEILPAFRGLRNELRSGFETSPRLGALLETSERVRLMRADSRVILLSCGWGHNPDLEYMLPGSLNFRNCLSLTPEEVVGKRLLLVHSEFFNSEDSEVIQEFRESCEQHVVFRREPFVVSECSRPPQ